MLYLVKLKGESQTLLKIGYTKDIDKRLKTYKTHNPLIELIDIKEGKSIDESNLHNLLKQYSFEDSKEWFVENSEIYRIWKEYKPIISEELQNNLLDLRVFKIMWKLAKLMNPKDIDYLKIYLGTVPYYKEDTFFKYFFKDELKITNTQYKKSLERLITNNYLISISNDSKLYILNPLVINVVESVIFNTN